MIEKIEDKDRKEEICRSILKQLPDWFGVAESIEQYANGCRSMPFWVSTDGGEPEGFAAMCATSPYCAEIYVMGVLQSCHRRGIGTLLSSALIDHARRSGYEFIQVKTVREGCYADYDLTNAFYKKIGFREFECFETLWDEANPCQIYIMSLK